MDFTKMNNKRHYKTILITLILMLSIQNIVYAQESINLLLRADDMGMTHDKNLAIIKAHKEGIITSASIMPTTPFFEEAVRLCKENPTLAVGIHITLVDTKRPSVLSPDVVPSILTPAGFFYETGDQLRDANPKAEEIEKEIRAQIGKVRASGLNFVYLDYHRSIPEVAIDIIIKLCHEQKLIYGQPIDGYINDYKIITLMPESWPSKLMPDGQIIYYSAPSFNKEEKQSFFDTLNNLKPGLWMTAVHPGFDDPQRASVTELLCSPKTLEIIKKNNIQMVSYHDLWNKKYGKI